MSAAWMGMGKIARWMKSSNRLRSIYLYEQDAIDKWDAYLDIYDQLFGALARRPVRLLEIGVLRGGSLRMWSRYFHRDSLIVGLDIDSRCKSIESGNIKIEIGDQSDKAVTDMIKAKYDYFDIVIDDGSHYWKQQILTFEELYDATRSMYVVEDTHTSYWPKYGFPRTPTFIDFAKNKIDFLHEYFINAGSPDQFGPDIAAQHGISRIRHDTKSIEFFDSMVVFKKGHNPAPFRARKL